MKNYDMKAYNAMTPTQKRHYTNAVNLSEQAGKAVEATKTGKSPKAAELIRKENIQRQKAGLIPKSVKL